jgi:hypothetical protein
MILCEPLALYITGEETFDLYDLTLLRYLTFDVEFYL